MKKKVLITRTKEFTEEIEIEFPVYKKHYLDNDSNLYTRIDSDLECVSITVDGNYRNVNSYEFEITRATNQSLLPDKWSSKLSREEFNKVMDRMVNDIKTVKLYIQD